jgi:hypothetical protein
MEYAKPLCKGGPLPCNDNFTRYVGYSYGNDDGCIQKFYSQETVEIISHKVSELLQGVHPEGKKLIVPNKIICGMMSAVQDTYRPPTGDIYSRYIIPSGKGASDYVQDMIDQVIEIIVTQAKTHYEMDECNRKLTVWNTVLGDFNPVGLQSHSFIKINEKKAPMLFNMNY